MLKRTCFLLLALLAAGPLFAGDNDRQQLEQAVEQFRQALISADSTALAALTDPVLTYGHSGGTLEDRATFIHNLLSGKSDFVRITLSNQAITLSGDVGIVRHELQAVTNDSGKPGTVSLHILLVWKKQGRGWKLLARQAVKAR